MQGWLYQLSCWSFRGKRRLKSSNTKYLPTQERRGNSQTPRSESQLFYLRLLYLNHHICSWAQTPLSLQELYTDSHTPSIVSAAQHYFNICPVATDIPHAKCSKQETRALQGMESSPSFLFFFFFF